MSNYTSSFTGAQIDSALGTVSGSNLSATHKIIRSVTLIVAALNSPAKSKAQADYVCDGDTDLTTINTALTAAAGGSVYLQEGTYTKKDTTVISIPSNTALLMSMSATLKFNDGLTGVNPEMISCSTVDNIQIQGGIIDGNKANTSTTGIAAKGISFVNVTNSKISDIRIKDTGTTEAFSGYGIYLNSSSYNRIESSVISGCKRESLVLFESSDYNNVSFVKSTGSEDRGFVLHRSEYNVLIGCVSYNDTLKGYDFQPYAARKSNGNIISGCVAHTTGYGIDFFGQSGSICKGNYIYNATVGGIRCGAGTGYATDDSIISDNVISGCLAGIICEIEGEGNSIINNTIISTTGTSSTLSAGIICKGSDYNIVNNIIKNGAGPGILLYNGTTAQTNIRIKNNSIVGNNSAGIFLRGNLSSISIENNYLRDNAKSAESGFGNGITLYGTNDRVFIDNNTVYGGTAQAYGIRVHSASSANTHIYIRMNIADQSGVSGTILDNTSAATLLNNIV